MLDVVRPLGLVSRCGAPRLVSPAISIGLHVGATDTSMPLLDLAAAAEERGFASLFVPEHSHVPVARRTPYPGGGEIPERYLRLWDPLVALAFVAARSALVVGTCVALPGCHDPISYAKAVATLDVQSGGRFVLGVGFGWNDDELADHGIEPGNKHAVVVEKIRLMQRIWTEEVASFDGEHVALSPSWSWPKPLQRPHPPILLGGTASNTTLRRVAEWADGWIPATMAPGPSLAEDLLRLEEHWAAAGRDGRPRVVVMQRPEPAPVLASLLARYAALGVEQVLIDVPTAGADAVLPLLDEVASTMTDLAAKEPA